MLFSKLITGVSLLATLQGVNGAGGSEGSICKTNVFGDAGYVYIRVESDQGKVNGAYSSLWKAAQNDILDQIEDGPNDTSFYASKESDVTNGYYDVLNVAVTMVKPYHGSTFRVSEWSTMLSDAKHCFGDAHGGVDLPTSWKTYAYDSARGGDEYYDLDVSFNSYKA